MAHDLRKRNAHERAGTRAGDAGEEVLPAHAGINDDRDRAEAEEREDRGDERQALSDHHQRAVASRDAGGAEARPPSGSFGIELGETEREVVDVTGGRAAPRNLERRRGGAGGRHEREMARDIGVGVGRWHVGRKARAKRQWAPPDQAELSDGATRSRSACHGSTRSLSFVGVRAIWARTERFAIRVASMPSFLAMWSRSVLMRS